MDIYCNKGHKIVFLGKNGWDGEAEEASRYLTVGEVYTVDYTVVHSWTTDVYLEEFPKRSFNSVMFEDAVENTNV